MLIRGFWDLWTKLCIFRDLGGGSFTQGQTNFSFLIYFQLNSPPFFPPPSPSLLESHHSVLLLAQDHLMMEVHVSKVLCYGEAAQTVTRVVEVSGSGHTNTSMVRMSESRTKPTRQCEVWPAFVGLWPDGAVLTCQVYPEGPRLDSDSTGGCTPARPAAQTSTAADSAPSLLHAKIRLNRRTTTAGLLKKQKTKYKNDNKIGNSQVFFLLLF